MGRKRKRKQIVRKGGRVRNKKKSKPATISPEESEQLKEIFPPASENATMMFCGTRRSGKTTLLCKLLRQIYIPEKQFDWIVVFFTQDENAPGNPYRGIADFYYSTFDADILTAIIAKQDKLKKESKRPMRLLVILDDIINEGAFKSNDPTHPLNLLAARGRHKDISAYWCSQSYHGSAKQTRKNLDLMVTFDRFGNESFFKEKAFCTDTKSMKKIVSFATQSSHGYMVLSIYDKGYVTCYNSADDKFQRVKCT